MVQGGASTALSSDMVSTVPSVALVHDYLLVMRGAERTFAAIASCWPGAPIFTLLYDEAATDGTFSGREVRTSYLQRLGIRQSQFRRLLPLLPAAAQSLPVARYDVVVSSSSAFAHGVRAGRSSTHICYSHGPFRYAWQDRERAVDEVPRWLRAPTSRVLARTRRWDIAASQGVTHYIANSELTRQRIRDFYGREAIVVHPPVEVERFHVGAPEGFFLLVGEAVDHKRFDLALEAARRAARHVKFVGEGPQLAALRREYGATAEFLGRVSDAELSELYAGCLALIVPSVEEFGITAVEAQASGRPVIAADAGGARETVVDGETGILVPPEDVESLASVLRRTDFDRFSPPDLRRHAERFSTEAFRQRFTQTVHRLIPSTRT